MKLADIYADYILSKNMDELDKMPPEQKKQEIYNVYQNAYSRPELTGTGEVTPTLNEKLTKQQKDYDFRLSQITPIFGEEKARQKLPPHPALVRLNRDAELQQMGVDTESELPAGNWELGFGVEPASDLQNVLTKHYGKKVPVFRSGEDIIYINPDTKKPVRANLPMSAKAGLGLPMAGDVGFTLLSRSGGPVASVVKETLLSGVGTSIGEYARLAIGKGLGVHDLSMEEMAKKAGLEGAEASAYTGAVGSLMAFGKAMANMKAGRVFTKTDAERYGFTGSEADEVVTEINDIIARGSTDEKVKLTLGQKTDDVLVKARETELKGMHEYAPRMAEREASDIAGTKAALDVVSAPELKPLAPETVQDVARSRVSKRTGQAEKIVATNTEELKAQLDDIGLINALDEKNVTDTLKYQSGLDKDSAIKGIDEAIPRSLARESDEGLFEAGKATKTSVGEPTRELLLAKQEVAKKAENAQWDKVKEMGGYDPQSQKYGINIELEGDLKQFRKVLNDRIQSAQTGIERKGIAGLVKGSKTLKPQDLSDYSRELSNLKAELRAAKKNKQFGSTSTKDLDDYIRLMEDNRNAQLSKMGRGDLLEQIQKAEQETYNFHKTFNRSVVGDLTKVNENGVPVIKSKDFVDDMLKRDKAEVDQLIDVIGDNPEVMGMWKEGLADAYKEAAYKGEKFNRAASNKFLESNKELLNKFFDKNEITNIMRTGQFAEKVEKQIAKLENFKKAANKRWGSGTLSSTDPEGLVKFVTGSSGGWERVAWKEKIKEPISKIRYVKNITKDHPAAWQTFTNDFKQSIKNDIFNPKKGRIDASKISNWVDDPVKSKVIIETLGDKYYKDLSTINKVVQMMERKGPVLAEDESKGILKQMLRATLFPPLTRSGRGFTAGLKFESSAANKAIANAILDEKSMRKIAELAKHNRMSRQVAEKAFSLGFALENNIEEE